MRLRREQGLLIAVGLLAALMWFNREADPARVQVRPQAQAVEDVPPPGTPLARGVAVNPARLALFREPSESAPLPPRPLPAPPSSALPVVWPPLPVGQHASAYRQLRGPGEVKEQIDVVAGAGDVAPPSEGHGDEVGSSGTGTQGSGTATQGNGARDYSLTYDKVVMEKGGQVYWGEILAADKHLLLRQRPTGKLRLRWVEPATGRVNSEFEIDAQDIQSVQLAKTLRNEVAGRELDLNEDTASQPKRAALIDWLLAQAGRENWIVARALHHGQVYAKVAPDPADGQRMVARVLRAGGRLPEEWTLYQNLPPAIADSSFRWTGQAQVQAILGLDLAAETDFKKATARPGDPRAARAYADFLLARGRADEALPLAQAAYRERTLLDRDDEQLALRRTLIACLLALGQVEEARNVGGLPSSATALRGAIAYAAGDFEFAAGQFRAALEAGDEPGLAALGAAACMARAGQWKEAYDSFQALAERDPFQRARALAGAAFVLERTGNFDGAAALAGTALQAAPTDAYLCYLRGRSLRLAGDLDGAAEQLTQALKRRDDLVEAMAEFAEVYLRVATQAPARAADALVRAMRYADRCVALDAQLAADGKPTPRFLELKGLVHWRAGDLRGARAAFEAARQGGSVYGQIGSALVDYGQARVETAREQLIELDKRPLGDPFREYGKQTLALIDDHAEKVEIRDDFERSELGSRWTKEFKGRALPPRLEGGRVLVSGKVDGQDVTLRRIVEQAGDFLSGEVTLTRDPGDTSRFAGLHLSMGRDGRNADFEVFLGFASLQAGTVPALRILDGDPARATGPEGAAKFEWRPLQVQASGPVRLLLEVVPEKGVEDKALVLRASWNGVVVAEEKVTRLSRGTGRVPLFVDLLVEGGRGQVDAAWDEFRLRMRAVK